MSLLTAPSPSSRSDLDTALDSYVKQTGIDITDHPFAAKLQNCDSSEDVIQLLSKEETTFEDYRDSYLNLIDHLRPVVQIVYALSGVLEDAFQPTKAIFVGIHVLLSAAIEISTSYDALLDVFECVSSLLKPIQTYTVTIPLSPMMSGIVVKIMGEVLAVLAFATKQIKQGRLKTFAKKLLGDSDVKAILQRLDRLTQEEARMTVANTLEVVHGLFNNLKEVMNDGKVSTAGIRQALVMIQETTSRKNKTERNRLQRDIRGWLSPPDPSINHNIARRGYLEGTALWFTESDIFGEWKATNPFLLIYGKPGAGKSVLSSSIIEEIKGLCDMGLALLTYFYCDFRDTQKQDANGLLSSLIIQLAAKSDPCSNVLSDLYSNCDAGSRQPGDHILLGCLEQMLNIEGLPTIYIIIDGLDECPDVPGLESPRQRVLKLMEKLVDFHLSNVRICATSRPEADIQASLALLASHTVSLHEEFGQKKDICDYVRHIVYSDRYMRGWKLEDKEMVVDSLTRRGDGMFRWIVCQLEVLRNCFPSTIRRALDDLPKSLDETYERILLSIPEEKQGYAQRLLHCLSVSMRPLRVEELADILAIKFEAELLPHYDVNWRSENSEEAVLLACSSLITIVNLDGSRVVQFAHFSVKEYLTSTRLANANERLSRHYIIPHSAHTILAQASLSVLIALDGQIDKETVANYPLTTYAARYWIDHARFDDVSSKIEDAMERLFDPAKPQFAMWVWVYDIDLPFRDILFAPRPTQPRAVPLYYATLCGFRDLVKHLIDTCPQDISTSGGYLATPIHAALTMGHVSVAMLLLEHGADMTAQDYVSSTPLHRASDKGHFDIVEFLLEHHVNVDARDMRGLTPLHLVSSNGNLDLAQALLRHGASVESLDNSGCTPLFSAAKGGYLDVVRLLLQSGAIVDSHDNDGKTPLMTASHDGHLEIVSLLLENGATADTPQNDGRTSLMLASQNGHLDVVRLLVQNGAAAESRDKVGRIAWSLYGYLDTVRAFLQSGAAADVHTDDGSASLMLASKNGHLDVMRLLLQSGVAAVESRDDNGSTSLMTASFHGRSDAVRLLLQSGAAVDAHKSDGSTPLMLASERGNTEIVNLLLQSGAAANASKTDGSTPLMLASQNGHLDVARSLLQTGVAVEPRDSDGRTPLMMASLDGHFDIVRLLLQSGAVDDSCSNDGSTALMVASSNGHVDIVRLILQTGANPEAHTNDGRTALMLASGRGHTDVVDLLLQSGAALDSCDHSDWNPLNDEQGLTHFCTALHLASTNGHLGVAELLIQRGADVNKPNQDGETPLSLASGHGWLDIADLLIKSGSTIDSQDSDGSTPLHKAVKNGHLDIVILLLSSGADITIRNRNQKTLIDVARDNERFDVERLLIERTGGVDSQERIDPTVFASSSQDSSPIDANVEQSSAGRGTDLFVPDWSTLLHTASREGEIEIVRSLLEGGGDVNDRDAFHRTALLLASRTGEFRIVQLLIKYGAEVNCADGVGFTPLHVATFGGHLDVVRMLLDGGADVNAMKMDHWTSLHYASYSDFFDIAKVLLDQGATVNERNDDGRTAFQIAGMRGHRTIMGLLSEYGAHRVVDC